MSLNFITNETLSELFEKLRFQPNQKARLKVREIINNDLQSGATYPEDAAQEIIDYLEIEKEFKADIVDALEVTYKQNQPDDYNFHPDNY